MSSCNIWSRLASSLRSCRHEGLVRPPLLALARYPEATATAQHAEDGLFGSPLNCVVYHACTHFREKGVFVNGGANSRNQEKWLFFRCPRNLKILYLFISICLFHVFQLLCINVFELKSYIRSNEKCDVHKKNVLSLIQLFSLSQKEYFILYDEKNMFCLKRVCFIGPKNQRFGLKRCFFRPNCAISGCFSNLGMSMVWAYTLFGSGGGGSGCNGDGPVCWGWSIWVVPGVAIWFGVALRTTCADPGCNGASVRTGGDVKPGLYFSRRLSAAVAYSFVARAGDHGRHRQLSFKCARALRKYKQSPDRTTKWSIHGIQIQMQIRIRIQIPLLSCIYTEK